MIRQIRTMAFRFGVSAACVLVLSDVAAGCAGQATAPEPAAPAQAAEKPADKPVDKPADQPALSPEKKQIDDLFKEASLWGVGSYQQRVNAATDKLKAMGEPALRYIIDKKLDTSDTLVTRPIEQIVYAAGEKAIDLLLAKLPDPSKQVRRNVINLLAGLKATKAAPEIAKLIDDPDMRGAAIFALGAIGVKDTTPKICEALKDPKERIRITAAVALGKIADPATAEALIGALADEFPSVRFPAVDSLAKIGPPAEDALLKALGATEGKQRIHVISALGRIKSAKAVEPLTGLLLLEDWTLRAYAAEAIGNIGAKSALDAMKQAAEKEQHPFAKMRMTEAVEKLGAAK
jgi:HEAT repeat protein